MTDLYDTLVASATAPGEAAIAIVRFTGDRSVEIVGAFTRLQSGLPLSSLSARRLVGCVIENCGEIVDQALVVCFAAPLSYTGEHMVELHLHGNPVIVNLVLHLAVSAGARLAGAGEFSRRAFLNGKLDLTQLEGLASVIRSESERGLFMAQRQLQGDLADHFGELRQRLVRLLGLLELELDFCEEGYVLSARSEIQQVVSELAVDVAGLLRSYRAGERLRRGPRILLMGAPNAGKSSLFNALVGFSRSLVSSVAGTTRDYVEEKISYRGMVFHLVDTAGVRETLDPTEAAGIHLSRNLVDLADLVLFLVDSTSAGDQSHCVVEELLSDKPNSAVLIVYTKMDLVASPAGSIGCSVLQPETVVAILDTLVHNFQVDVSDSLLLLSRRQFDLVSRLASRLEAFDWGSGDAELLSYELRELLRPLDQLSGVVSSSEVLNEIFASFCIGK